MRSLSGESSELDRLARELLTLSPDQIAELFQKSSSQEQRAIQTALLQSERLHCKGSLEYFGRLVKTKDEHADGSESVRRFPDRNDKPYLWRFFDRAQEEPVLIVEKSRQLMLTWAICLFALWTAKYQANRLICIQSKKYEDAAALVYSGDPNVARISFMEWSLPEELRSVIKASDGYLYFDSGSQIIAIPEGGDQIRSKSPSLVVSDEYAFQPEAESAWKAIKPLVDHKGGRFIAISTANGGAYMQELIRR